MKAVDQRIASRDPIKIATYSYQHWLAIWRNIGGESDSPFCRYVRQRCKEVRQAAKQSQT